MIKARAFQYYTAVAVSLATASMGTYSGWATPVIPKLVNNESGFPVTKDEIGWILAFTSPGFMGGSLIAQFVSQYLGRRTALMASSLPMTLAAVILVSATNVAMLYVTKFLWGFGTGMVATVAPMYLAEISDKERRASIFIITRFTFSFGVLLVMSVGPFLSYAALSWSLVALPVCFFAASLWMPESPYYLLKVGRVERARGELWRLRGTTGEELDGQLKELQEDVRKENQSSGSVYELFTGKRYRRAIVIAVGLKVTQILTGTVTVQQYLGLIIQEGNMSISISTALIVFASIRFVVSLLSSFFVDRVGRVPLLLYSYLATGLALTVVGFHFYQETPEPRPMGSRVAFACIILANVASTVGFSTVVIVVIGEIFPLNVKEVAMTFLNIFGGFIGMGMYKGYEGIKSISGLWGVFWFFAASAYAGALFSKFFVPETGQKSLKEIQVMLQGKLYDEVDENVNGIELKKKKENECMYNVNENSRLSLDNDIVNPTIDLIPKNTIVENERK